MLSSLGSYVGAGRERERVIRLLIGLLHWLEAWLGLDAWTAVVVLGHGKSALHLRWCVGVVAGVGGDGRGDGHIGHWFWLWVPWEGRNLELGQLRLPSLKRD